MSDESNVIQFPKTTVNPAKDEVKPIRDTPSNPNETAEQKMAKSQEFVLNLIEKNRVKGIKGLQDKLETLTNRELHPDPKTESALRDVQGALSSVGTHIEANSSLTDYLKHDLMSVIQNIEGFGQQGFQTAAHLQCLIALLVSKGVISHEEMKETWDALIRPKAEALAAGQQEEKPV